MPTEMKLKTLFMALYIIRITWSEPINNKFPENFLFGVATSSHQIEGGWNADGKGENIWDNFTHTYPEKIFDKSNADTACDSYHKYLEDVNMVTNLGADYYRFSLSWSRILPSGRVDHINQAGVSYYKKLITALKLQGIEPYVTLYHWDLPQPLQDLGGWINPLLEDYFVDYARLAFILFGDDVKTWLTFNEPLMFCNYGYGAGTVAPGYQSEGKGLYLCGHTVLKAHAKVYHMYQEEFRSTQKGRISFVVNSEWYNPASNSKEDAEAAERKLQFDLGWFANPVYHPEGNYPKVMIERIAQRSKKEGFSKSRLPEFTQQEIDYIKGSFDFFCINTYTTNLVKWREDFPIGDPSVEADTSVTTFQDPTWTGAASEWLKVVPWGIRKLLNWISQTYNHPEIVITENGYSDHGELDDQSRIIYYSEYLSNVLVAILEDGINVTGYTAWSLMDDFEWVFGYNPKFGLYHVDFESANKTRRIKKSGEYYKNVIATKRLTNKCED